MSRWRHNAEISAPFSFVSAETILKSRSDCFSIMLFKHIAPMLFDPMKTTRFKEAPSSTQLAADRHKSQAHLLSSFNGFIDRIDELKAFPALEAVN
jgi:hypothetical protein